MLNIKLIQHIPVLIIEQGYVGFIFLNEITSLDFDKKIINIDLNSHS